MKNARGIENGRSTRPTADAAANSPYRLTISRLTVDKLGVKLYDKASAVVAELVANSYDADAKMVTVRIPLNVHLATTVDGKVRERGYVIEVEDDGHGMTPREAMEYYLRVGTDRRLRATDGRRSRILKRPVMGRKGIGKLAPFGICRRIEVRSAGGAKTSRGYAVTNFFMDFDRIVTDEDTPVPLEIGDDDHTWSPKTGTQIRLSNFLAKRVPDEETFFRQLAVRFTFARPDFEITVVDTADGGASQPRQLKPIDIPVVSGTRVDLATRPVLTDDGRELPVTGWLAMAKEAYKNEEMAGVRIYARGKIVGVTRDFNQPAGFTGEFTMRSYLVGQVEAEWLDLDQGEDLIRTDRQDILWDSECGQALQRWGAELIREIAGKTREPRRVRVRDLFMQKSNFEKRAEQRFGSDKDVARVAVDLAKKFGSFAAEDELEDDEYIDALSEFILSVAPHQALIEAFQELSDQATQGGATLDSLLDIFDKTQIAELASYAQIAAERVRVIEELTDIIDKAPNEGEFQSLLAKAPWLIEPSWTVITQNQSLKTFKHAFEKFWKSKHNSDITLAISYEDRRPDFTLVSIDGLLHIVEIKKAAHAFDDGDFTRLLAYVDAFEEFFAQHPQLAADFRRGWVIDVVADSEKIKDPSHRRAWKQVRDAERATRISWNEFLLRAKKVHEQFLEIHDRSAERKRSRTSARGGKG
jgi:Histidine kinase-, DNA gyrase B-, and HSP90-like ATPase